MHDTHDINDQKIFFGFFFKVGIFCDFLNISKETKIKNHLLGNLAFLLPLFITFLFRLFLKKKFSEGYLIYLILFNFIIKKFTRYFKNKI